MSRSIVYVTDSLAALDDSLQLKLLVTEMARSEDWEVHVVVIALSADEPHPLAGLEVKFHQLIDRPGSSKRIGLTQMLPAGRALKRLLGSIRPDVVHTWGQVAQRCMGVAGTLPKSGGSNFKWIASCARRPEKSGVIANAVDQRFCNQIEKVLVPHTSLKQPVVETGFAEDQVVVVPNAAVTLADRDTTREKLLARIGLSGQAVIVAGTVADLTPATRMKDVIWATDLLNCIRDDFHLVLFGDGHQRQNLDRFASFTEAQSHVHFLPPDEAEGLMGALDVYWHSHLLYPMPSSLLCAMANAVPAISVYGDETEEIIQHQQTAMAVNYGARDEFARWTKFLIEKPEAAKQLADQGKAHVLEKFPLEEMVAGYQAEL